MFAVQDPARGGVSFRARVGGGLSTAPRFSKDLGILAGPDEVVELCGAIGGIFHDESTRQDQNRAGVHFVVEEREIPRFRAQVEARLGHTLRRAREPEAAPVTERDRSHLGINAQQQKGLHYIGISMVGGRTSGDELHRLASLAEEHGGGPRPPTNTQNIMVLDVSEPDLNAVTQELGLGGVDYHPGWARKAIIA